jgi:hypothetical protein
MIWANGNIDAEGGCALISTAAGFLRLVFLLLLEGKLYAAEGLA